MCGVFVSEKIFSVGICFLQAVCDHATNKNSRSQDMLMNLPVCLPCSFFLQWKLPFASIVLFPTQRSAADIATYSSAGWKRDGVFGAASVL